MAKINEYPQAASLNNNDLFVIDQTTGGDHATKSATMAQISEKATATLQTQIGSLSTLTTTDKSSLVGAVNEVDADKADKTLVNDLIKVKNFTLLAANVTRNMDLSSNVSLDSGYKFLCYMPTILPDGFTTDQYLWISAPTNIQGNPWWNTNPISGAGTGTKLRFYYLEIKDIT